MPPDPLTRSRRPERRSTGNEHARPPPPGGEDSARRRGLARTLTRIAHEIIERNDDLEPVALVGIHTRGVPLARASRGADRGAERRRGRARRGRHHLPPRRHQTAAAPSSRSSTRPTLDFELAGTTCVLVDDVLYTGRTIRAAIETLFEHGRPARVQLAVLVDRGHRELPIRPDYVGKNLPTARSERIQVELEEIDGTDRILLIGDTGGGRPDRKHLLSIADLDPRRRRAGPRDRAVALARRAMRSCRPCAGKLVSTSSSSPRRAPRRASSSPRRSSRRT